MREVFGDKTPADLLDQVADRPLLGAAGAQEAIYCLLMMNNGFAAESANIENLDPAFDGPADPARSARDGAADDSDVQHLRLRRHQRLPGDEPGVSDAPPQGELRAAVRGFQPRSLRPSTPSDLRPPPPAGEELFPTNPAISRGSPAAAGGRRHGDDGEDDRVPQAGVEVADRADDGEAREGHEAADPAGADVVGQRHGRVAHARREQLHQAPRPAGRRGRWRRSRRPPARRTRPRGSSASGPPWPGSRPAPARP